MKNIYEIPELNVTLFYTSDVMTASDNDYEWDEGWNTVDGSLGQ